MKDKSDFSLWNKNWQLESQPQIDAPAEQNKCNCSWAQVARHIQLSSCQNCRSLVQENGDRLFILPLIFGERSRSLCPLRVLDS
ncbi:MAG: hypothetical protein DSM106950_04785 [Stigonema ocellatum SAG 48.90 = DSM 106950]|nr:hypothetical protein [Stigonema ocellatum SAG 48.90 = DSM 106950]